MRTIHAEDIRSDFNIAIVTSRFNDDITQKLHAGAVERLEELGFAPERLTTAWVPGAVEIPLVAKQFAKQGTYSAIICLGAVIRGETSHYDYVCDAVTRGCMDVSLDYDLPVIFGVLTTENKTQALARVGGAKGHKGRDAADSAYEMVSVLQQIA